MDGVAISRSNLSIIYRHGQRIYRWRGNPLPRNNQVIMRLHIGSILVGFPPTFPESSDNRPMNDVNRQISVRIHKVR